MDYYEIWCNLREGVRDIDFSANVSAYLDYLEGQGLIEGFRLARRKLGFGPPGLGEFNVTILVRDLAQLERAFQLAATRSGEVERLHSLVYSSVRDTTFALYRDYPDPSRIRRE